jgi:hypothetical protein
MTEKILLTKDQAMDLLGYVVIYDSDHGYAGLNPDQKKETIRELEISGYIKKSELQQKVEEVEKMYDSLDGSKILHWCKFTHDYIVNSMYVIQLFKQKYPEEFE